MRRAYRLRKRQLPFGRFTSSRCSRFGDRRLKVRGARSGIPASVFGKLVKALFSPASCPPNKSFKPTPCRRFVETSGHASNTGSHPSRSARLNSGVRRQKSIWQLVTRRGKTIGFGWHRSSDRFSVRLRFGQIRLARSHSACVTLAGFGFNDWLAASLSAPDALASVTAD